MGRQPPQFGGAARHGDRRRRGRAAPCRLRRGARTDRPDGGHRPRLHGQRRADADDRLPLQSRPGLQYPAARSPLPRRERGAGHPHGVEGPSRRAAVDGCRQRAFRRLYTDGRARHLDGGRDDDDGLGRAAAALCEVFRGGLRLYERLGRVPQGAPGAVLAARLPAALHGQLVVRPEVRLVAQPTEASALRQVAKCELPMLFIHGDADDFVPTRMVYPLYEAKPGEKELWVVPGAAHAMSYRDNRAEYTRRVAEFVGRYVGDGSAQPVRTD